MATVSSVLSMRRPSSAAEPMRRSKLTPRSQCKDRVEWEATIGSPRFAWKQSASIRIRYLARRRARREARKLPSPWSRRSTSSRGNWGWIRWRSGERISLPRGDSTPFGQKLQNILAKETLEKAVNASGWKKPRGKNVGRGVAVYERPSGAGRSGAAITIEPDGKVKVLLGVPDVGPGIHTVVQQIVS